MASYLDSISNKTEKKKVSTFSKAKKKKDKRGERNGKLETEINISKRLKKGS